MRRRQKAQKEEPGVTLSRKMLSDARVIAKGKRIRDPSQLAMVVKLKRRDPRYRDLTVGQRYVVIGIEADELRLSEEKP